MGHLWGWNVLQVGKLRWDGEGEGCGGGWREGGGSLSAGYSSEKTRTKIMNVFLSSLRISLGHSFHCFIKCLRRRRIVHVLFSESENLVELLQKVRALEECNLLHTELINVWNSGRYLFQRQLYLHTAPHTHTNNIWTADFFSSHSISLK